jgi:acetylornithine deacetylase/succinyl-diaminopimelate desuccinylase-like protein
MFKLTRKLLGAGLLGVIATSAMGAASRSTTGSPQDAATAKAILSELLAIDTTYENGTVAAVAALRTRFLAAGFPATDLVVVANPANPSQSNLIVRLKGHGSGKPLLYLCHLDVVAAKPEDWSVPPFALTEKDGWIYGRGSLDMKGEDANVAAALLRLKREAYKPARDIIVGRSFRGGRGIRLSTAESLQHGRRALTAGDASY